MRQATPVQTDLAGNNVVLFDGVCVMCNGLVDFTMKRDRKRQYFFAALQSATGQKVLNALGLPTEELGSMVLIEAGLAYTKSTAALRVARNCSGLWPVLYAFIVVPAPLRDRIYDWVGNRRYRWFGQLDECRIPTPEEKARFLD